MKASNYLHRSFVFVVMIYFCAAQVANAASDNGTLTKGQLSSGCNRYYGFGGGYGSYSPTGLTGGKTVGSIADWVILPCSGTGAAYSYILVSGFSSSPGSAWLTSVTCNGVTKTGASASFSYNSGSAVWTWGGLSFGFSSLSYGTNVSCTIVHS